MSEAINKLVDEMEAQMDAQAALLWEARELIGDLGDYMDKRVDVVDGAYGEQEPNEAMEFVARIDEWIRKHKDSEVLE